MQLVPRNLSKIAERNDKKTFFPAINFSVLSLILISGILPGSWALSRFADDRKT